MPAKNAVKEYAEGGYYHIYNRGVEKRNIFLEKLDYVIFITYLKQSLCQQESRSDLLKYHPKNFFGKIELLAFVLMPNHFHFLLKQNESLAITEFIHSLLIRYTSYFNKHHNRIGHLFQGVYKGVLIDNEAYLLWLTRYIHRNPIEIINGKPLSSFQCSSYPVYLDLKNADWIHPEEILALEKNYQAFVENPGEFPPDLPILE